jgi:hypothetical protein
MYQVIGGMFDVFDGALEDAKELLTASVGVIAIWFVVWTWVRTRSIVPVVGAVLLGAVVLFGVSQMDGTLKTEVQEDVNDYSGR